MVVVQAGEFTMGSGEKYTKPKHRVVIANQFAIGLRKVTFEEFCFAYADADRCKRQPKDDDRGRGSRAVIGVTWDEAKTFVKGLSQITGESYRLPSEAEWEYADHLRIWDAAAPGEWVEDCWNESYDRAPKDGTAWNSGDCEKRVLRGADLLSGRWRYERNVPIDKYGFRVVRSRSVTPSR
jgi:formylglycine-generating enzyme required for sulfatase activity